MKRLIQSLSRALVRAHGFLCDIYTAPIRLYRRYFSGLKSRGTCRFQPTCSAYALEAVREWGILIGSVLALIRVVRCNPFSAGGDDPVPKREEFRSAVRRIFRRP